MGTRKRCVCPWSKQVDLIFDIDTVEGHMLRLDQVYSLLLLGGKDCIGRVSTPCRAARGECKKPGEDVAADESSGHPERAELECRVAGDNYSWNAEFPCQSDGVEGACTSKSEKREIAWIAAECYRLQSDSICHLMIGDCNNGKRGRKSIKAKHAAELFCEQGPHAIGSNAALDPGRWNGDRRQPRTRLAS